MWSEPTTVSGAGRKQAFSDRAHILIFPKEFLAHVMLTTTRTLSFVAVLQVYRCKDSNITGKTKHQSTTFVSFYR